MVIVGDAPFVSDSILDARAKARHPSNVRLERGGGGGAGQKPRRRLQKFVILQQKGVHPAVFFRHLCLGNVICTHKL